MFRYKLKISKCVNKTSFVLTHFFYPQVQELKYFLLYQKKTLPLHYGKEKERSKSA